MAETPSREDVRAILGPIDDLAVAAIIGMGATTEELVEAKAWIENDEAMLNAGRRLASGRVAALVDLLAPAAEEDDPAAPTPSDAAPGDDVVE